MMKIIQLIHLTSIHVASLENKKISSDHYPRHDKVGRLLFE